jgi:CheY-like chemotaxis protein
MDGIKVLCVENHPESMATLKCMLEGIGCDVMPATSAEEALDLLANQTVDGVLLEDNLPCASGVTIRCQMKTIRPEVPVFVFAGISRQTPFMVRFFYAYLHKKEQIGDFPEDLNCEQDGLFVSR